MSRAESIDAIAEWHRRPVKLDGRATANAMSVDVEDYFQVEAFFDHVPRQDWPHHESRVEHNVDRILALFSDTKATATFFALGWLAERYPQMVRRIVSEGHELACHGYAHFRADQQSRPLFVADVRRAKRVLEDVGGVEVKGYRAASFSITRHNLWALNALEEAGFAYSSSTFPIHHDNYGMPAQPRFAFYPFEGSSFVEIPITTRRLFGQNVPSGGGGYFRLLPYEVFKRNLQAVRRSDNQPCLFYFHPWEIDPNQPRISGVPLRTRVRHYLNLHRTEDRLSRLLRDFRWARIDEVYPLGGAQARE